MGSLIAYGGVVTRMKIMERWRVKDEQFLEMAALETVADVMQYLCAFLSYREILGQMEDKDLYRRNIEQHLNLSQYGDFAKSYQLINTRQRCLLDLHFMYYEITILETCLRNVAGRREQRWDLSIFRDFLGRYSALDLVTLFQSQSMEEFIENLKGPTYYGPLYQMLQNDRATPPAHETALDILYSRSMWKIRDKYLSRSGQRIIAKCFGIRMGILNPQWICCSGRLYQLEPREIHAMLISIQLHLIRKEVNQAVEAKDLDILYGPIRADWYDRTGLAHLNGSQDLDHLAHDIISGIYQKASRKDPYPIAMLDSYLYFEGREAGRIITAIEEMRYGLGAS